MTDKSLDDLLELLRARAQERHRNRSEVETAECLPLTQIVWGADEGFSEAEWKHIEGCWLCLKRAARAVEAKERIVAEQSALRNWLADAVKRLPARVADAVRKLDGAVLVFLDSATQQGKIVCEGLEEFLGDAALHFASRTVVLRGEPAPSETETEVEDSDAGVRIMLDVEASSIALGEDSPRPRLAVLIPESGEPRVLEIGKGGGEEDFPEKLEVPDGKSLLLIARMEP